MNFLAHFFFDGRLNKPYYNMGLVLPDLMGISERGWKIHQMPKDEDINAEGKALKNGIQYHHQMDEFFHNSDFFNAATTQIKAIFRNSINTQRYRLFFVAHIFLELMMDRLIVNADPTTAKRFYQELNQVKYDQLKAFFNHTPIGLRQHFRGFLQQFLQKRYVLNYTDNQSMIYALNRIFERVGHPVFEGKKVKMKLNSVIFETENYIESHWKNLVKEMKSFGPHAN